MFRGYDSSDTFCEDMLLRIKDLYEEIGTIQKSMEKIKLEPLISKKSIQKLKQNPTITWRPKKRNDDPDCE
ncbi:MAG: hypothetical protein V3R25_07700 [Nitrosomonadaceae bacterium]|jgi:hypothetical protein